MRSILVIESNSELRGFVTALLIGAGHQALAADSVPNAAALLSRARFEVVVTDLAHGAWGLPGDLADLRQQQPELQVVALSEAARSAGYLRLAAALGGDRTLGQPFMSPDLIELTLPTSEPAERPRPTLLPVRRPLPSRLGGLV